MFGSGPEQNETDFTIVFCMCRNRPEKRLSGLSKISKKSQSVRQHRNMFWIVFCMCRNRPVQKKNTQKTKDIEVFEGYQNCQKQIENSIKNSIYTQKSNKIFQKNRKQYNIFKTVYNYTHWTL